jgi:glycosyltransferase involved in cell wall biosynthesis
MDMTEILHQSNSRTYRPPARPRRVLMLSTAMGAGGGAEEQVIQLAYGMKSRGLDVRIVSLLAPSPMPAGFEERGIPLLHLGMRKSIPDPRAIRRYNQIVREFEPDVVHTHLVHANLLGRIGRMFQPVPALVCTLHSLTMTGVKRDRSPIFEIAHRLTDRWCDRMTAICHSAAEYAVRRRAVLAWKMSVVHNGIDTKEFSPDASVRQAMRRELGVEAKFVWLAVGRLEIQKAYPVLLKAMSLLPADDSVLLICGQGSLRAELETVAAKLGVASRVRFLGMRKDVPKLMNAADGMVLSSDIEGLPLVLLQAGASALPMVSTDVGGNGEAVIDGENGWLVPPQSPQRLARAMARLMSLAVAERRAMGEKGRQRVCNLFETERVVERWLALYTEILRSRQKLEKGRLVQPPEAVIVRPVG